MSQSVFIWLSKKASAELKTLLENKHLYQHVNIHPTDVVKQALEQERNSNLNIALQKELLVKLPKEPFTLSDTLLTLIGRDPSDTRTQLTLIVGNVSLFCKTCDRREVFAPVWYRDVTNEIRKHSRQGGTPIMLPDDFQLFFLTYQCQKCLGNLEGFIVRRLGWTLALHGRSPIEQVEVPHYVPKPESLFYRDAILAHNSGKTLAALFYLRTFVEQFARRVTGLTGRLTGDEILDKYYELLPSGQKDYMPSLREWYDKVSEALHGARADAVLFESAKTAIDKHFEIRKVYEMPETSPEKESNPA
jgi:hypothetical protein